MATGASPRPQVTLSTGRYDLGDVVGGRGTVVVRRADDRQLRRRVAVLALRDDLADDAVTAETFRREAATLASTVDAGLAKVFDVIHDEGRVHVVAALADAAVFDATVPVEVLEDRVDDTRLRADLRAALADCAGTSARRASSTGAATVPRQEDETVVLDIPGRRPPGAGDQETTILASAAAARPSRGRGLRLPSGERQRVLLAFASGLLAVVVAAVVVSTLGGLGGDDSDGDDEVANRPTGPEVEIARGQDLDPYGSNGEHPEDVPLAFDGDPATRWDTEGYNARTIDIKPGVGMWVQVAEGTSVSSVEIDLAIPGVDLDVYAMEQPPGSDMAEWGQPAASADDASGTFAADVPDGTSVVVVWFRGMGEDPEGDRYRAGISEIRLLG